MSERAVTTIAVALALTSCDGDASAPTPSALPPAAATFDDGTPRQKPEFDAIATRLLRDGAPDFFPGVRVVTLRKVLGQPSLPLPQRLEFGAELAGALMETGEIDDAIREVDRVEELGKALPGGLEKNPALHWLRGMIYLRQAEVQNCILRHNRDCCVFPLKDGGIHKERGPADKARESFLKYARLQPADLRARWMINLVAMAVGEYPDSVPADLRLPPEAFDSGYDLGRFPDVAAQVGLDTFNHAGAAMAEDFDGDGLLDVVTSSVDVREPMSFRHNDGDGKFSDRTKESRLDDQLGGLNCVAADYDDDGDVDFLVLRGGWLFDDGRIRNSLMRNDGKGVFQDVTRAAGVLDPVCPTQVGVWADFDDDGDLDLFVGNESRVSIGEPQADYPCSLYRNDGDGTFTDVAKAAGVACNTYVKGAAAGDFDNDGRMDLYVSNVGPNLLFRNEGSMRFRDVTAEAGVAEPSARSFATWFFDYDNDGWLDLYVGGYDATIADVCADYLGLPEKASRPALYHNEGDGTFKDVARKAGLDRAILPMGANFGDLDNDGWLDFYLTTGSPKLDTLMPNLMFRNDGGARFQDVTKSGGFGHLQKGHGVAFADLDNDGDQDVFHQIGGFLPTDAFRNALYENPGHGRRFLTVELQGTTTNRSAIGARIRVTVETPGGRRDVHRAVGSVSSFGGSPVSRQAIGLGDATSIVRLEITWPTSRTTQVFEDVAIDAFFRVIEGRSELQKMELPVIDF